MTRHGTAERVRFGFDTHCKLSSKVLVGMRKTAGLRLSKRQDSSVVTPCQTNDSCRTPRNGVINECVTKKSSLLCFVVAGGGFPGEPSGHSITSCVVCCRPIHSRPRACSALYGCMQE